MRWGGPNWHTRQGATVSARPSQRRGSERGLADGAPACLFLGLPAPVIRPSEYEMGLGRKHRRGFQEIGYAFLLVKSSDVQEEPLSTDARSRTRRVAGDEVLIRERRREDCDFLRRNPSLDERGDIAWRRAENSTDPPKRRDSGGHVVCPPK